MFTLGEGEWFEIQKRLCFQTSGFVKTPNQVAYKWRQIKQRMDRDIRKVAFKGDKIITSQQWILSTLRTLNNQDPTKICLSEEHFKVLNSQIYVDPNTEQTPYQSIVDRFQREQQVVTEQRAMEKQKKQEQEMATIILGKKETYTEHMGDTLKTDNLEFTLNSNKYIKVDEGVREATGMLSPAAKSVKVQIDLSPE